MANIIQFVNFDTMLTKGQPMRRHLRQYFGNKRSLLWFITKNFEHDTA